MCLVILVRIRLRDLRRFIHEAAKAVYGWPTDEVEHVYGVPDRLADTHPTDLGNLRLPKGPNTRDNSEDRDTGDITPEPKGYGAMRGVGYNSKSNNDNGRGGGGGM